VFVMNNFVTYQSFMTTWSDFVQPLDIAMAIALLEQMMPIGRPELLMEIHYKHLE